MRTTARRFVMEMMSATAVRVPPLTGARRFTLNSGVAAQYRQHDRIQDDAEDVVAPRRETAVHVAERRDQLLAGLESWPRTAPGRGW
jgi:hypothetical protein